MQKGKASIEFENPPVIVQCGSVTGTKEGEGPLAPLFDSVEEDDMLGKKNWEEAESAMQKKAASIALQKAGLEKKDIRYLFSGDLLGQLIATSFGLIEMEIPMFGLFGACSTMGEAISLGAMTVHAGYAERVISMASSHYATAEKQFRFPLAYGNQRPASASWTVTGCGSVVIGRCGSQGMARIRGITTGQMIDLGARDSMNMGAAMAPAAYHTMRQNLMDFSIDETYYDKIITGDLGEIGSQVMLDFGREQGMDLKGRHMDCGVEIFDKGSQDTHAGGSGCGCSAVTLCAYILPRIMDGTWKRVLFIPTGALLSTISYNEGQSIPGIAHGVMLEHIEGQG